MMLSAKDQIIGDAVVENQATSMPVFGNVRESEIGPLAHGARANIVRRQQHATGLHRAQSGDGFEQLRLSIAFHAGDAQNFARADLKTEIVHGARAAVRHH